MATEKQISSIYQNGQRYRIIGANVHDSTVSFKNADGSINYGSMTTNQESDSTVNLPIPTIDSALSSTSENPVQNKKVKEALDTKITNPSGGNAGQVLKKTANGEEWADESGGGGDEIVYLTQDEYDALTPEEKMNGTHYGIVGNSQSDNELQGFLNFVSGIPLSSGSFSSNTTIEIPEGASLIMLMARYGASSGAPRGMALYPLELLKSFDIDSNFLPGISTYQSTGIAISSISSSSITLQTISGGGKYFFF